MRFLLFLIFISPVLRSQDADTLLPSILALENDTARVNELYKKGFSIRNTDPAMAYRYGCYAEQAALKSGSPKHLAKSYNLLGVLYYKKGDLKTALNYHQKALELRMQCWDVLGIAHSQTNLGNIYTDLNLYEKAETSYLKALAGYKETNQTDRCATCLLNLGIVKQTLKQYDAALENYAYALRMAESINDQDLKSSCLNNMAFVYGLKGDVEKAIAYNEDALKLRTMMENKMEAADSYLNLVPLYLYVKEPAKAKRYLDTASYIGNTFGYAEIANKALRNYATYYAAVNEHDKAYTYMVRYEKLKDSLALLHKDQKADYEFNEPLLKAPAKGPAGMPNSGLLGLVVLSAIFIPYALIRQKR